MQITHRSRPHLRPTRKGSRLAPEASSQHEDSVSLSSSPVVEKAKGLGVGALVGLASGALALTGPVGFLGGIALSTAAAAMLRVDPADSATDSAATGATFGVISAGMGAVLGFPGVLAGGLMSGIRAAICR